MLTITNEAGRRFCVTCIPQGGRYGLNGCLRNDGGGPIVEFTDLTTMDSRSPVGDSPFVARYHAGAILERGADDDLWLFGRNLAWRLAPEQVRAVRDWLRGLCGG